MDHADFGWVRARAQNIWPDVIQSVKTLKNDNHFLKGPKKKVSVFISFLTVYNVFHVIMS